MDILVVDDEKTVRESTRIALEMDDHYVEAVSGGTVAMLRLKEEDFDLVLIDLNLGGESALDIIRRRDDLHRGAGDPGGGDGLPGKTVHSGKIAQRRRKG